VVTLVMPLRSTKAPAAPHAECLPRYGSRFTVLRVWHIIALFRFARALTQTCISNELAIESIVSESGLHVSLDYLESVAQVATYIVGIREPSTTRKVYVMCNTLQGFGVPSVVKSSDQDSVIPGVLHSQSRQSALQVQQQRGPWCPW